MNDLRSLIFASADKHAASYPDVPHQHAAILPSELLAFIGACRELGIDDVVESGRRFGYSTEVLDAYEWSVTSIESHPLPEHDTRFNGNPSVWLLTGDGTKIVPQMVEKWSASGRVAVLLDGPKGTNALALAQTFLDRVVLVGIHDCFLPETKAAFPPDTFFTDDPEYVERFGWLDAEHLRFRGYTRHSEILPVAGVLGILRGGVE